MKLLRILTLFALLAIGQNPNSAQADPEIPPGAKPLTNEEIKAALGGKTFKFVAYDSPKSLTGTSTWDLGRGIVYGDYVYDNQSPGNYPVDVPHKRPYIKDTWLAPTEGTAKCPTPQRPILKY